MDNVLNLSAFGEIIPGKKEDKDDITFKSFMEEPEEEKKTEVKNPANLVSAKALQHTAQIKMLHWQTKSYAEHKSLDKLFKGILNFSDDLVETIMGKYGRPHLDENHCNLVIKNYTEPGCCTEVIEDIKNCYMEECKSFFSAENDPEILNILDEIIALLDKTMYLLTLK